MCAMLDGEACCAMKRVHGANATAPDTGSVTQQRIYANVRTDSLDSIAVKLHTRVPTIVPVMEFATYLPLCVIVCLDIKELIVRAFPWNLRYVQTDAHCMVSVYMGRACASRGSMVSIVLE